MKRYVAYITPKPNSQHPLRRDKLDSIRVEFHIDPDIPYNGPSKLVEDLVRHGWQAEATIEYRLVEEGEPGQMGVEVILPAGTEPGEDIPS